MINKAVDIATARHSLAHILAAAVGEMFPGAKFGMGPAIDDGFYYDFDLNRTLSPEDLPLIEEGMRAIIAENLPFTKAARPIEELIASAKNDKQRYKIEILHDLSATGESEATVYNTGEFNDVCKGPHVESTSALKNIAFKLDKIAGAYWKGTEKNVMLQRVYGIAFTSQKELDAYIHRREEAEKRDHRRLGAELNLFSFHEEAPGFPFWHPKGMALWNTLIDWWHEEHERAGYDEIKTPMIMARELWERSGHWDHYRDNMYFTSIDERDFSVKPMNCPGAMLLYRETIHSYRDFPMRWAEIGQVHRHEPSGTLHGLLRVRAFHQDDAHIFCLDDQIEEEVGRVIKLADKMYTRLGLKYHLELSTRPEKGSIGSDEDWQRAEDGLKDALNKRGLKFKLNPGDGAFYGPKIDFHLTDAIGRTWQAGTVQLDFAMPERFNLEYVADDGTRKRPVMLHRVIFGSIERFIGVLIEHYAGAFPLWLAPEQARILPISDKVLKYAREVLAQLKDDGIRATLDETNETLGKKIRLGEVEKVPYLIIIGEKEQAAQTIAVRVRHEGDLGSKSVFELISLIKEVR